MPDVNWNNVVSAVATVDGLLVTERGADGQVGLSPRLLPGMPTAERAWQKPRGATLDYGASKAFLVTISIQLTGYRVREVNDVLKSNKSWQQIYSKMWSGGTYQEIAGKVWHETPIYVLGTSPPEMTAQQLVDKGFTVSMTISIGGKKVASYYCSMSPGEACVVPGISLKGYELSGVPVPEEGGDLGAASPWDRPGPGRQTNTRFIEEPLYVEGDAKMSCTDSALKTYRWIVQSRAKLLTKPGVVTPARRFSLAPFKACSDTDAWSVFFGQFVFWDEAYCATLERLDAKPGYASAWTVVKTNCDLGYIA